MVQITRGFLFTDPKVFELEGIKCYALCPNTTETPLVTSYLEERNLTKEDVEGAMRMKILTVKEIGEAVMKSFKYDKVRFSIVHIENVLQWSKFLFRMDQSMPSCQEYHWWNFHVKKNFFSMLCLTDCLTESAGMGTRLILSWKLKHSSFDSILWVIKVSGVNFDLMSAVFPKKTLKTPKIRGTKNNLETLFLTGFSSKSWKIAKI